MGAIVPADKAALTFENAEALESVIDGTDGIVVRGLSLQK